MKIGEILVGDCRELSKHIPNESVDIVFTDPIYENIEDYIWLGVTSKRVLKPDGALLVWSNGRWQHDNAKWLETTGLIYRWTFTDVNLDRSAPMNGKIIAKANRVLWFDKSGTSKMRGYLPDGYATYSSKTSLPRVDFKWHKSPKYSGMVIEAFTNEGDFVVDFFAGSATILSMAKQLRRNYWGCEIDPETAEKGRWRIEHTQIPAIVLAPEQGNLWQP